MDTLRRDIQYALRSLGKSPSFTAIAAICIALGIATNVFVWSPINALLLRPLPYHESERIMQLSAYQTTGPRHTYGSWSYPDYIDAEAELKDVFSSLGTWSTAEFNVGGSGEPERLRGARVSPSLFPLLRLEPAKGRFFRPDEDGAQLVAVIGYGVWERKFGSDPAIIGKTVPIDGVAHEIIGVMTRGMRVPEMQDIWVPLNAGDARDHRERRYFQVLGRLAPGVTVEQADRRVTGLMRVLEERHGNTNNKLSAWVVPQDELIAREVRPIFLIMLGAVGFVLLIASANVANLLLARGAGRQREVAVRLAMGASRHRIVRQFLTESLILAAAGGAFGILLGTWMVEVFMKSMMPTTIPFWMDFSVDRTIVLVSIATTFVTGFVFGVWPAFQLSRPSLTETLKESGGRGSSASASAGKTRSTLVIGELALSMVLLVGAGLMVRSFLQTQNAGLGFDPRNLLTFQINLAGGRYESDSARAVFIRNFEQQLAATPGIEGVGIATQLPVAMCCRGNSYFPEGKDYPLSGGPTTWWTSASPGFLPSMRIPILAGRNIEEADTRAGAAPVVVIDSSFAAREWPGASAIGRRVRFGGEQEPMYTVVGIMSHLVMRAVNEPVQPQAIIALAPSATSARWFSLRTKGDPAAFTATVRRIIRGLDPDLPLAELKTMDFVLSDRMFQPRVYGSMFAIFAIAALTLATIGLYGVMSYLVAQRTREVGVRMALGADRSQVLRLVMSGGMRLIVIGLLIGFPASLALSQLLRGLLFGVSATDPVTLLAIPSLLSLVALIATWVPARRATRVDPMVALRSE